MTTISSIAGEPTRASASVGFWRRLDRAIQALLTHIERRAAIKALHELDDHALRDIGISRCQIEAAVGGALSGKSTCVPWEIASGSP